MRRSRRNCISLVLVTPLGLASCAKTTESSESPRYGNHTDAGVFDSVALRDGRGLGWADADTAASEACSEDTDLFAVCEAPLAQPSDDAESRDPTCPFALRTGGPRKWSDETRPVTHAATGDESHATTVLQFQCEPSGAPARLGTAEHAGRSGGESACSCTMKECGCA